MARAALRAHPAILRFCVVTTAVSAAFWIAGSLVRTEVLVPGLPVSAGMFIAPAIGAWCAGRPAQEVDVRRHPSLPRAAWRWLAWLTLMPAVLAVSYVVMRMSGLAPPEVMRVSPGSLVALSLVFVLTAACEEVGWTRLLTATLAAHCSLLAAGLAAGGLWAALHVIPYLQAGRSWSWITWQCAFTLAFRLIIVAAVALSAGSWLVAVALHAGYNIAWASFPVDGSHYDPRFVTPVAVLVAIGLVRRAGRRRQATCGG